MDSLSENFQSEFIMRGCRTCSQEISVRSTKKAARASAAVWKMTGMDLKTD